MKDYLNKKLTVSIADFGAVSGTEEVQTEKFQAAIDHCFINGGGVIEVPKGEYVIGSIRLRSNTTLHLLEGATLLGSKDTKDYFVLQKDKLEPVPKRILVEEERSEGRSLDGLHYGRPWMSSIIKIYRAKNVAIIGEKDSYINGRDVFDPNGEEGFRGPHTFVAGESENLYFNGYTIINSSNWGHCIWHCKNIVCEKIKIVAGHDGFDVFGCKNVLVQDCNFFTGDDCVAGFGNYKVRIKNCNMSSSCSAFRFSGTDVYVENCDVEGNSPYVHRYTLTREEQITNNILSDEENPNHRYRMKCFYTYYGDNRIVIERAPSKIVFDNCRIKNPTKFFHYNYSGSEYWSINRPLIDITFKNITLDNFNLPMVAYGDFYYHVTVNLENITLNAGDDFADTCLFRTANLKKLSLKNFNVNNFKGNVLVRNYGENTGKIVIDGGNVSKLNIPVIEETDDKFEVEMI